MSVYICHIIVGAVVTTVMGTLRAKLANMRPGTRGAIVTPPRLKTSSTTTIINYASWGSGLLRKSRLGSREVPAHLVAQHGWSAPRRRFD